MPGVRLSTDAFVLRRQPSTSDNFEQLVVFSREHGTLTVLRRKSSKKKTGSTLTLDLFDEVSLELESPSQGRTWFLREAQLIQRFSDIGKSYERLVAASKVASLIARNPVHEESRDQVADLLGQAFTALNSTVGSAEVIFFKTLFCFARDEGYPAKQDWWENLPVVAKASATTLLNTPLADLNPESATHSIDLTTRLELWLRRHTEIIVGESQM